MTTTAPIKETAPHRRCTCGATVAPANIVYDGGAYTVVAKVKGVSYKCGSCGTAFETRGLEETADGFVGGPVFLLIGLAILWLRRALLPGPAGLALGGVVAAYGAFRLASALREQSILSRHPVVDTSFQPGSPLPPATAQTPYRRCTCGGTLGAQRIVYDPQGRLVSARYRCSTCTIQAHFSDDQRLYALVFAGLLFGGGGAAVLASNLGNPPGMGAGAALFLFGGAGLAVAWKEISARRSYPIIG
jgi:hypothetical protein